MNLQPKIEDTKKSALFADFLPQQQRSEQQSISQEIRSTSITTGISKLTHEMNVQVLENRPITPQQFSRKTEQSFEKSELSTSWNSSTARPYSPAPPRPLTPGARAPNPEGLVMEKLWTPVRSASPAVKPEQIIERSSSPLPSNEAKAMEKLWTPSKSSTLTTPGSESVERSASPRPRSEGIQMEKLWAHKLERKSETVNTVPAQQVETPATQPQIPPEVIQPQNNWTKNETVKQVTESSRSVSETRSQMTVTEQSRKDSPLMVPPPKPIFQPITPAKPVQHYVAETAEVIHKATPMFESREVTRESTSQFHSQSIITSEQSTLPENTESNNPNVVTERGIKPSEAKKMWAQRTESNTSQPAMPMPKPILKKQSAFKQSTIPSQEDSLEALGLVPGPPPEIGYMHRVEEQSPASKLVETKQVLAVPEPPKVSAVAAKSPSPAAKSMATPPRQLRPSPSAGPSNRSLTPTFTVKPFDPFPVLEPFPFQPDPVAPTKEKLPPPPTPSKFERGEFLSDVERDLDSVKISAKWKPYESDCEDQPTYRKVRPPSTPLFDTKARSSEPEPLPPSKFERPSNIEGLARAPVGLQLSDFSSALNQSSVNQSSVNQSSVSALQTTSSTTSRRVTTSMEQRVSQTAQTTTKTSGSPALVNLKHDVFKKPVPVPKKRGEFLPESGYMADTDEPRRQLKKQAEEPVVKESPPVTAQHKPEPKVQKKSPIMRDPTVQQKVGFPLCCSRLLFVLISFSMVVSFITLWRKRRMHFGWHNKTNILNYSLKSRN